MTPDGDPAGDTSRRSWRALLTTVPCAVALVAGCTALYAWMNGVSAKVALAQLIVTGLLIHVVIRPLLIRFQED